MSTTEMLGVLKRVKLAMRLSEEDFNDEVLDLIHSALDDLGIAGVNGEKALVSSPLVRTAVTTYCKLHFGEPDDPERLKKSYDEQKAQLSMATGYTTWTDQQ